MVHARGRRALLLLLALDLALQLAGLMRAWHGDPFAASLRGDAQAYWDHAGRLAAGQLVDDTPFLSAPLYAWLLGLLRALGTGLPTIFVLQLGMRSATAWLVARCAHRLAGSPRAGLLAAGGFLLLADPAFHAVRLLNPALQLLLVALLLEVVTRLPAAPSRRAALGFGVLLGANLLAGPPMLVAVPVFALWLLLRAPQRRAGLGSVALALAGCAATIAPATLHNALATARHAPGHAEFLLLSAQAGVTFAHGNAAGADGTYLPLPDVPASRAEQNAGAYASAAAAGVGPGWGATSRYYFARGIGWLRAQPGDGLVLLGRKLLWLCAGSGYGDVYHYGLESRDRDWPPPLLPPTGLLQTGWLLPLALLGLALLLRRRGREALPWLALLAVPVLVVLVFWYSPRYRLPLAPVAAVLAVYGLRGIAAAMAGGGSGAARAGRDRLRASAGLLAVVVLPPLAVEGLAAAVGIDDPTPHRATYERAVAVEYMQAGRYAEAVPRLQAALGAGSREPRVHEALAECLVQRGTQALAAGRADEAEADYRAALPHYAAAIALDPTALDAVESACNVLRFLGEDAAAREVVESALDAALRRSDRRAEERLRSLLRALPED